DGWLALPADLGGLDVVSLGLGRLPTPGGLLAPAAVRALLQAGVWRAGEVVERVLSVLALATERVARYAPTRLARPLEFLARAGVGEADLAGPATAALISSCRATGAVVELSERHRLPGRALAAALAAGGVPMVAASDAHTARDVGRWNYLTELNTALTTHPLAG